MPSVADIKGAKKRKELTDSLGLPLDATDEQIAVAQREADRKALVISLSLPDDATDEQVEAAKAERAAGVDDAAPSAPADPLAHLSDEMRALALSTFGYYDDQPGQKTDVLLVTADGTLFHPLDVSYAQAHAARQPHGQVQINEIHRTA
jgi:hypothetical protein